MNWRIRSIFWLMTTCIVGINAFQGYWLWTTYQLNRQQFSRTVQDALFQVLERQQVAQATQLVKSTAADAQKKASRISIRRYDSPGDVSSETRQTHVFIHARPDGSPAGVPADRPVPERVMAYDVNLQMSGKPVTLSANTLARRISNLVLLDWIKGGNLNLAKLEGAYQAELHKRSIDATFRLDTFTIQARPGKNDIFIFRDSRIGHDSDGVLRTLPVPINPTRHLFGQASFAAPSFYLFSRMGWLLGGSLALLSLTTGCFLFMLSTILQQKKLSEVKSDFINNMTHELKTPIATVTAAVEAMQHFGVLNDPQRTQTYLTISRTNLQRLSDLVEKVLNLAVEEKRELVLRPEPLNLSDLANDLISNCQLRAPKPVVFDIDIPADAMIRVDRIHFSNALNNLLDNAINYSQDRVAINLTFRQDGTGWQLAVIDNGIGIAKTYQSAIFDRFFRVPTGDLHSVKGFGLGLAYVRQVVERHGGRVQVHSEPGKGSEFLLKF